MRKQWIIVGTMSVCILFLVSIWLLLRGLGGHPELETDNKEVLFQLAEAELATVEIKNSRDKYVISWNAGTAQIKSLENLPLDTASVNELKQRVLKLESVKGIRKDNLGEFGLDEPVTMVKITDKEDDTYVLAIGDDTPNAEGDGKYVLWKEKVYVVDAKKVAAFEKTSKDFLSKQITPATETGQEALITKVVLRKAGEELPLTIEYMKSEKLAGYKVNSYQLTSPLVYPASASIEESFFSSLFGIAGQEIAYINPGEEEVKACRLDIPYRTVEVEYQNQQEEMENFQISVSEPDAQGNVCVMTEGVNLIYICAAENVSWMEVTEQTVVSHTIAAPDVGELSGIVVKEASGESWIMELQDIGEEDEKVLYEKKELSTESFKNLYYMLIDITADEVIFTDLPETEEMEKWAEITFQYEEGKGEDIMVTYYREETGALYALLKTEGRGFRLSSSQLDNVLESVRRFAEGEEIKARY